MCSLRTCTYLAALYLPGQSLVLHTYTGQQDADFPPQQVAEHSASCQHGQDLA